MAAAAIGVLLAAALAPGAAEAEARIALDVREAPVVGIVQVLAEAGGFQVVFDAGTSCALTMKLPSARWRQALDAALGACGLGSEEEGDVLRVATLARLREEAVARRRLQEERDRAPAGRLASFRLSYARAQELAPLLTRILSPNGRITYDARTSTLLISY